MFSDKLSPMMLNRLLFAAPTLFALLLSIPATAQEFNRPEPGQYEQERSAIQTILSTIVEIVEDAAHLSTGDDTRLRLQDMTDRLTGRTTFTDAHIQKASPDLEETLRHALAEIQSIRSDLTRKGDLDSSRRLEVVEDMLADALDKIRKTPDTKSLVDTPETAEDESTAEWLEPGKYSEQGVRQDGDQNRLDEAEDENAIDERTTDHYDWDDWRHRRWNGPDSHDFLETFVGEFTYRWPFRESAAYRTTPAIRYNRVEGVVLGFRRMPLEWDSFQRARLYGTGGYAFGSDKWQYEVGAEGRVGRRYGGDPVDLKIGGSYRRGTYTNDLWKSTWAENSLAAFFFNYDFFDYYETEGYTVYATSRLTRLAQVTVAFRDEDYSSLGQEVTWSLFGGDNFRFNFPIDEGSMQSVVVAVEGGRVTGLNHLPDGVAFRGEAEFGKALGGDFSFNRYTGDLRTYMRTTSRSSLSVRLRGGLSEGDMLPVQKQFTIGGIGSIRAYPQNAFAGSRVILANAEYAMVQGWLWDELLIAGFFDAGWTNTPASDRFKAEDMFKTVGVGVGLFDRAVRLDLAFPLDHPSGSKDPTLWLRLTPAF